MKSLLTYTVALAVVVIVTATATASPYKHISANHDLHFASKNTVVKILDTQIAHIRKGVAWNRSRTWYFQSLLHRPHTPTTYAERHTRSVDYLDWIEKLWSKRRVQVKRMATGHLPATNDWVTAVRVVQRAWPGSQAWLLSCSSGEGGHGRWVPNTQGSGAGGWMQYMSSTFWSQYDSAIAAAKKMRLPLPAPSSASWYSAEGQAYAAGWAHNFTDYHGPWDPAVDPKCE